MEERLQKYLAQAGIASRRAAEKLMMEGRVTVNGTPATKPGLKIDPERDAVKVDGKRVGVKRAAPTHIILNKPRGYITTVSDPEGRPTVMDLIKHGRARIYPVGRLDFQTEGLLLLTDDGELARRLMHPSSKVPKTYRVKVKGFPARSSLEQMRKGMILDGKKTMPAIVRHARKGEKSAWFEVSVTEGRKHLIRKMFQNIGNPVLKLRRTGYGDLVLKGLASGEYRRLTDHEVAIIRQNAGIKAGAGERPNRL